MLLWTSVFQKVHSSYLPVSDGGTFFPLSPSLIMSAKVTPTQIRLVENGLIL
jgi:hypothetical protein